MQYIAFDAHKHYTVAPRLPGGGGDDRKLVLDRGRDRRGRDGAASRSCPQREADGQLRSDINRYLKWAFVEAANTVCLNRRRWPGRHVSRLYERIQRRKGHDKAIGAVARHLAEATYWILTKQEPYREPKSGAVASTEGSARYAHELQKLGF